MADTAHRINITLKNKNQYDRWKKYLKDRGFGSLSGLIRFSVENEIKGENIRHIFEEETKTIKDSINGLFSSQEKINSCVDLIDRRLSINGSYNNDVIKAAREIVELLSNNNVENLSEIVGKSNFNRTILNNSLILLKDLGIVDMSSP